MHYTELNEILSRNNVPREAFFKETYDCMIVSIFEALIDEMSDSSFRKQVRSRLQASNNQVLTVKRIVQETTHCSLSHAESERVLNYLIAFFRKKSRRVTHDDSIRNRILAEQNYQCNICGRHITVNNSELDHIIPWSMVGDELGEENLQMLCKDCNRRKSKNVTYNLKMFLISR